MEKKTLTDLSNRMTEMYNYYNLINGTIKTEFELETALNLNGTDSIMAVSTDDYCYIENKRHCGWIPFSYLSNDVIDSLYHALDSLYDDLETKFYNIGNDTLEDKLNELFESHKANIFEFSTDSAVSRIVSREIAEGMLASYSKETLAKKYLDACDIIAKIKDIIGK